MRLRAFAALAAALAFAPAIAGASSSTTFISYSTGVVHIRVAVGTETAIAFAPNEQIVYASIDDALRWDAHETTPARGADNTPVPRVAITPAEPSQTNMLIRTTGRTYHLHLQAVEHAPAQVAFVYSRAFISRAADAPAPASSSAPAAIAAAASSAPAAIAAASPPAPTTSSPHTSTIAAPVAIVSAPQPAANAGARAPAAPAPAAAAPGISPAAIAAAASPPVPSPLDTFAIVAPAPAPNPCPGAAKVSNTVRTLQYSSQALDAVLVAKALRAHSFAHTVFGVHSLMWYFGELAVEDAIVNHAIRKACPATQNVVRAALGAAAAVNAASIPTAPR